MINSRYLLGLIRPPILVAVVCLTLGFWGWSSHPSGASHADDGWRRTAQGWQRMDRWHAKTVEYAPPSAATHIHPFAVAAVEALAAICVLGFAASSARVQSYRSEPERG